MASTAQNFDEYFLTHRDIKQANPTWSDRMVDDYLALKGNLLFLSDNTDESIESIINRLAALEALIPVSVYLTANHTTERNELITCANTTSITVTLNATPVDQEIVQVKRLDEKVTVDGNGSNIDGDSTVTLNRKYTNLAFVYSTSAAEWGIR